MRTLLPFLLFLPLFSFSQEKKAKNDLTKFNYKGEIKSIIAYTYKAVDKSGEIEKDSLISKSVNSFNTSGFITEQSMYKQGNKLSYERKCKYDVHNNVIEENRLEQTMACTKPGVSIDNNSLTRNLNTFIYQYDVRGNITEEKSNENGKPWFRVKRILAPDGNVTEEKIYQPGDILNKIETYHYDAGNISEKAWYHADSTLIYRYMYKYDTEGNMTVLIVYRSNGMMDRKQIISYDGKGNKTEDINYTNNGKVNWDYRCELKNFDSKGNWTSEVVYDRGEPKTVVERTIEYY